MINALKFLPSSSQGISEDAEKTIVLPPIPSKQTKMQQSCSCLFNKFNWHSGQESTKNPFIMPPDRELFTLRERERQKMKEVQYDHTASVH